MKNTTILNEANKILKSLQSLQNRCEKLFAKAVKDRSYFPPHIQRVLDTIDDLSSFDLEDAIVNAYDYED